MILCRIALWDCFRFFYGLLRGCAGNWVKIRPKITHNAMDPTPTQCQSQSFHKWPKYLVENHFYTSDLICLNLMECLPTS